MSNDTSNSVGLLPSFDYGYRLLPSNVDVSWICGVFNSKSFDKALQISPQGINSVRLTINLSFNLSKDEYAKFVNALMTASKSSVMVPMSYIDGSGVLKECILYFDSISQSLEIDGRYNIEIATVTDTASAITQWKNSCFVNADVKTDSNAKSISVYDIILDEDNKKFYYSDRDIYEQEIINTWHGSIQEYARIHLKSNKWIFEADLPFEFSTQPDFFVNEFLSSYPIRAKKGDFSYDYRNVELKLSSITKKKLICILHFLEHLYGYKNFKLNLNGVANEVNKTWWNSQEWNHSWAVGDYHNFSIKINQNHLPYE